MIYDTKGFNEELSSEKGLSVSPPTNQVIISGFEHVLRILAILYLII